MNQKGRPTKYDPSFIQKIEDYIATCGREQTKLPKIEDICILLDVDYDTVEEWGKKYPDFSRTIKKVVKLQKGELIDDGLFGGKEVNASMAIFLLKANHGLIETEKKILAGVDDRPIDIRIVPEKPENDNRITDPKLPEATGSI